MLIGYIFIFLQLTAFAYKDYMQFGYVDQGLSETANLLKQFNINTYAPTILVFKESTDKPADIIQVQWIQEVIMLISMLFLSSGSKMLPMT